MELCTGALQYHRQVSTPRARAQRPAKTPSLEQAMTPVRFRDITPTGTMCITASYGNRKIVQQRQFQSRRLRQAGSAN
jgi:hypothetical protein